jgi:hypothetical protein
VAALDLRSVIQEELQSNPTLEELPMEGVSLDNKSPEDNPTDRDSDANGESPNDSTATNATNDQSEANPSATRWISRRTRNSRSSAR